MQNQSNPYQAPASTPLASSEVHDSNLVPLVGPAPNAGYKPRPANLKLLMRIFYSSLGLGAVSITAISIGGAENNEALAIAGLVGYLITIGLGLWATVMVLKYFYRAWSCVDSRVARTTPGKAIGYLFIPFFNFYWAFMAYAGLAKDYNRSAEHAGSPIRMNEKRFLTFTILIVATAVPYLGLLAYLPLIFIAPKVWKELAEVVNHHSKASAQ